MADEENTQTKHEACNRFVPIEEPAFTTWMIQFCTKSRNLEWNKKDKRDRNTPCYVILAKAVRGSVSDDGDDSEDESEDEHIAYHINSKLYSMISDIRSGHPSNLQLRNADQSNGST